MVFRPGVSRRRTVFENLLLLYRAVARETGASVRLVVDEAEVFSDPLLEVVTVPPRVWQPWRGRMIFPTRGQRLKKLESLFKGAELVVTVDPLIYPQAELAIEGGKRAGARVWIESTVTLLTEPNRSRWPHRKLTHRRKIIAAIEQILIPSPKVIERFAHHHLADVATLEKFQVVGHPVDTESFKPAPTTRPRRTVLCLSRLVPEKGLRYIIRAFRQVLTRRPDARLIVVGEGPMLGYLLNLCREEPLNSSVEFLSNFSHEQLPAAFQAADVFINHALSMPWWEEYFGVANLEAMACGLPVILTRSGAIPSVLTGGGKILWTGERDVSGIAQQMLAALDLPPATESNWVQDGYQFVQERYAPEACAQRWLRGTGHANGQAQSKNRRMPLPAKQSRAMATPTLLIVFNREEHTRQLINRLREVKAAKIYVAADGPRPGVPDDVERCTRCRDLIDEIDWPCEIQRRYSDTNQGCRWGPVNAINWFFEHEAEGIILEDDILPDPTFFQFCEELLNRYRDSRRVGCICGYNFLPQTGASYFFSRISLTWGWATWRDRWQNFAEICGAFDRNLSTLRLRSWLSSHDEKDMKRKLREAYNGDHVWDFLWMFSLWSKNQITVLPSQSLTCNIGIGEDSTHTWVRTSFTNAEARPLQFPLHHPKEIQASEQVDRALFRELLHTPTLRERIETVLRSGRIVGRLGEIVSLRFRPPQAEAKKEPGRSLQP